MKKELARIMSFAVLASMMCSSAFATTQNNNRLVQQTAPTQPGQHITPSHQIPGVPPETPDAEQHITPSHQLPGTSAPGTAVPTPTAPRPGTTVPGSNGTRSSAVTPGTTPPRPGVTPTAPGTAPATPGVAPAAPGTTPATTPGVTPPRPGVTPAAPGTAPATTPGVTPPRPGVTPAAPGTAPATPGVAPATPGVTPAVPGTAPTAPTAPGAPGTPGAAPGTTVPGNNFRQQRNPNSQSKQKQGQPFVLDNFKVIETTLRSFGVDSRKLANYIKEGKKLEDVLREEKISVRKFKKQVMSEYFKAVDQAVMSKQLTQDQARQLKKAIKETVKGWMPRK